MKKAITIFLAFVASCSAIAQNPCESITTSTDKFTDEIISSGRSGRFKIDKITKDNRSTYYLQINQPGAQILTQEKGLIILLESGKKILKPDAVIEVLPAGVKIYYNRTRVQITQAEFELLKTYKMVATRLHKNDAEVENPELFVELLKCL